MYEKVIKCERTWLKNTQIIAKTFIVEDKINHGTNAGLRTELTSKYSDITFVILNVSGSVQLFGLIRTLPIVQLHG